MEVAEEKKLLKFVKTNCNGKTGEKIVQLILTFTIRRKNARLHVVNFQCTTSGGQWSGIVTCALPLDNVK